MNVVTHWQDIGETNNEIKAFTHSVEVVECRKISEQLNMLQRGLNKALRYRRLTHLCEIPHYPLERSSALYRRGTFGKRKTRALSNIGSLCIETLGRSKQTRFKCIGLPFQHVAVKNIVGFLNRRGQTTHSEQFVSIFSLLKLFTDFDFSYAFIIHGSLTCILCEHISANRLVADQTDQNLVFLSHGTF